MAKTSHQKNSINTTSYGSRTDIGLVRDHNEDSLIIKQPLFVVADGMGGHAAGEIASEIAIKTIVANAPTYPDAKLLSEAVSKANREIVQASYEGRGKAGMGTTVTAAMIDGERLVIAQVGDSRAYLLHNGQLQQLTRDHSLVADMIEQGQITAEQARTHPQRSVITRALGSSPYVDIDLYELNIQAGDRLLLCSDGLSSMLHDSEIREILAREQDPQECADILVDEANNAGGYDNTTVIVVDIAGFSEIRHKKSNHRAKRTAIIIAIVLALSVIGAGIVLNNWIYNSAYLIDLNGKVAVYQGIPDSVLGLSYSRLDHISDVNTTDLNPGVVQRLQSSGVKVESLDAANKLLQTYEQEVTTNTSTKATANKPVNNSANTITPTYKTPINTSNIFLVKQSTATNHKATVSASKEVKR